jgi:hypothetical protein
MRDIHHPVAAWHVVEEVEWEMIRSPAAYTPTSSIILLRGATLVCLITMHPTWQVLRDFPSSFL